MPTVAELKQLCKDKGIKGYSKLNKAELMRKCIGSSSIDMSSLSRNLPSSRSYEYSPTLKVVCSKSERVGKICKEISHVSGVDFLEDFLENYTRRIVARANCKALKANGEVCGKPVNNKAGARDYCGIHEDKLKKSHKERAGRAVSIDKKYKDYIRDIKKYTEEEVPRDYQQVVEKEMIEDFIFFHLKKK